MLLELILIALTISSVANLVVGVVLFRRKSYQGPVSAPQSFPPGAVVFRGSKRKKSVKVNDDMAAYLREVDQDD